jgi:hypothetical protein
MRTMLCSAVLLSLSMLGSGCGGGNSGPSSEEVGAACTVPADCTTTCLVHGDFGPGMCSLPCASDQDCPTDAACVQVGTGMCVVACSIDADCAGYPQGWVCGEEDAVGGGQTLVCRLP